MSPAAKPTTSSRPRQAEDPRRHAGGEADHREEQRRDQGHEQDPPPALPRPDAVGEGVAERGIDEQQDRAAVGSLNEGFVPLGHLAEPGPGKPRQLPHGNLELRNAPVRHQDVPPSRRRIEKATVAANITDFYICSLSSRSLIYKGMFLAEQLSAFYPDLLDERFVSRFAIFHQRYSTNTFPQWKLAQPFRVLPFLLAPSARRGLMIVAEAG